MIELPQNLIDALRAGDEDGYRQLYDLYYESVYVLVYGILQNDADAQDAVQRTFIQVFRKLSALKNDAGFVKWLLKIANNEALMILRSRRPAELFDEEFDSAVDLRQDELMLPEVVLEQRDTADRLRGMIARLPYEQRQTLTLHYDQGLKVAEIAEIMDCSESTVKSRLRYARLRIKKEWEEQERTEQKKLNGVMLPFGEVFVRLLRQDAHKKRRKAAVWKRIKAFLRHRDDPGYAVAARAENIHALRIAAGIAASFVAVMFASATLIDAVADSDEPSPAYGFGDHAQQEKVKESNVRETVYIMPQDIVEQRIADVPNGAANDVVYYYEMDTVPERTEEGLTYRLENATTAATQPSTELSTEPPTEPPTQARQTEPPTEPPTQARQTEPPAQPTTELPEPPTETSALERMLTVIGGQYTNDVNNTLSRGVSVSGGLLYAYDNIDNQPLDPIRFTAAELLNDGIYRFELEYRDHFSGQYGYYYPAGTPLSAFPSELAEQMRYMGYRIYGVSYSDGAYRLQKDALLFVDPSGYGTYYGHHLRSE